MACRGRRNGHEHSRVHSHHVKLGVPKEARDGCSPVNTVINYRISLGLAFASMVEVHVKNGGKDVLRGYRGAFYFTIILASK
jgi:hypothetical protein